MIINMGRVLKQTALRFSERTALVNVERDRRVTFWQLHQLTNKVSNMLSNKFGLGEGDVYATLLENANLSLLHYWMTKASSTPLWLGIRDSLEEHLYQIDHVKPRVIFIETKLLPSYYEPLSKRNIVVICMDTPDRSAKDTFQDSYYFWKLADEMPDTAPTVEYVADDAHKHAALLRFTGGTTGRGKCALYSLSNLLSSGCNPANYSEVFPFDHPKALLSTPMSHASGAMVFPVYFKGGTIYTLDQVDIELMCKTIEKEKIELIYVVPTILYRMLDLGLPRKYDLSSLKTIRYGAQSMSPSKLEGLIKEFGKIFVQGYASTESWIPITLLGRNDHGIETEAERKRLYSVGRPVPGVEIKIADDNGNELPLGERGEIWIRGPHTVQGYYNDPEQTEENFSENGFWKSGDIGYMDDEGFLYLVDRKKDMIVSGGLNIYANEVENCINAHPAVEQSAVVGIPDDYWGEAVHAEVILKEGEELSEEALIEYCKGHIARHKAPKTVRFVNQLPLSPVGKVLRRGVREKYWKDQERRIH